MVRQVSLSLALCFVAAASAHAQGAKSSWRAAKNASADHVYFDNLKTFYCGCPYTSDNDSDGSGKGPWELERTRPWKAVGRAASPCC